MFFRCVLNMIFDVILSTQLDRIIPTNDRRYFEATGTNMKNQGERRTKWRLPNLRLSFKNMFPPSRAYKGMNYLTVNIRVSICKIAIKMVNVQSSEKKIEIVLIVVKNDNTQRQQIFSITENHIRNIGHSIVKNIKFKTSRITNHLIEQNLSSSFEKNLTKILR